MNRDYSIVPVRRLDLDSIKESVMRQIKDYPYTEDIFDVVADDVWGVVETVYGLYPVSKSGMMPTASLSAGGSFIINFHPILDTGETLFKNGTSVKVDINNIKQFEFDFAEPLSDFIARIGPETERAYSSINDFFLMNIITTMDDLIEYEDEEEDQENSPSGNSLGEEIELEFSVDDDEEEDIPKKKSSPPKDLPKEDPIHAMEEKDVNVYGQFIIKDKCTCSEYDVLVYVDKQGICSCKYFPKHKHCAKCGGRITKKG
jgi:hypothetical protein